MAVEGKLADARTLRLREWIASGEIEDEPYNVTINVDRKAIFVEMMGERMMYSVSDMVVDAYDKLTKKKADEGLEKVKESVASG